MVSLDEIVEKFHVDKKEFAEVAKVYPFRLNRYFFSLIKAAKDPIWIQSVPDKREIEDTLGEADPFCEDNILSPVPNLVHRYDDRVILIASDRCAMYCRHCMRKRRVGQRQETFFDNFDDILNYIKNNPQIEDVIVSGGDPLLLSDEQIEFVLSGLRKVRKDSVLRIHTRTLSTLPQRITQNLCEIIKKYHPIYINTHFNHPAEITQEASKAAAMLADSGVALGCQTVFLKGVNDNYETMSTLLKNLLKIRIKPYYLHHPDPIRGISHLKPELDKGLEIMRKIRGRISGMAVPYYMIDLPQGGGKVPLIPEYIKKKEKDCLIVENYKGKIYRYPL